MVDAVPTLVGLEHWQMQRRRWLQPSTQSLMGHNDVQQLAAASAHYCSLRPAQYRRVYQDMVAKSKPLTQGKRLGLNVVFQIMIQGWKHEGMGDLPRVLSIVRWSCVYICKRGNE
jgi:hypothetical protein